MSEKKKKSNLALILAIITVLGFGGAFVYYAYEHYLWWRDGQLAQENTNMVADIFQEQVEDIQRLIAMPLPVVEEVSEEVAVETISFSTALLDEARELTNNPDIVAYIYIEGTNINNVVLQTNDNQLYLYRDMFGASNVNGAIFMDYRNTPNFNDQNTIIYGHNMRNGTMFHDLRFFINADFAEKHPHIKIITDERVLIYEIFSVFVTHIDFDYIQVHFDSPIQFADLLDEIHRRRFFNNGIVADINDNILVLSTCTNVDEDTRIVVVGRLARVFEIKSEG